MIVTALPHSRHVSMSILKARFRHCAQVIEALRSAGVGGSAATLPSFPLPRFDGVTHAVLAIGRKDAVESCQIHSGLGHQDGHPRQSFPQRREACPASLRDCMSIQTINWMPNTAKPDHTFFTYAILCTPLADSTLAFCTHGPIKALPYGISFRGTTLTQEDITACRWNRPQIVTTERSHRS